MDDPYLLDSVKNRGLVPSSFTREMLLEATIMAIVDGKVRILPFLVKYYISLVDKASIDFLKNCDRLIETGLESKNPEAVFLLLINHLLCSCEDLLDQCIEIIVNSDSVNLFKRITEIYPWNTIEEYLRKRILAKATSKSKLQIVEFISQL